MTVLGSGLWTLEPNFRKLQVWAPENHPNRLGFPVALERQLLFSFRVILQTPQAQRGQFC